jgi:hypothetical protein
MAEENPYGEMGRPLIVSFGGGVNSTAMLIGFYEQEIRPDLILFADTGGELPHTYAHVDKMSEWCVERGFPEIIKVRYEKETLEENCHRVNSLPSIAYGHKKCSHKFKRQPQDKFCNNWEPAREAWKAGEKCTKCIGFDFGEVHRLRIFEDKKYKIWYPLFDWEWTRKICDEKVIEQGFCPAKSACFYCPSSKKQEIKQLKKNYPEYFERAIAMEQNADLTSIKGLGRKFAWEDFIKLDEAQAKLFPDPPDLGCGCFNG